MSDLASLLASMQRAQSDDFAARFADAQAAFTAIVERAIATNRTDVVSMCAREVGPAMLKWIEASGGVASLIISRNHAEIHVNLARKAKPPEPHPVQVLTPDIATGFADAPAVGE